MSRLKIIALTCGVVFLSACSSFSEPWVSNEEAVVTPESKEPMKVDEIVEYTGIEIWSSCLPYIVIQDDEFAGYKPRYFNTEGVEPIEQSAKQMECISGLLKDYPEQVIEVRGFTDVKGSQAYNLSLSQERAAFVIDELLSLGVADEQLTSAALGESEPINDNATAEQRLLNRRVEFVLIEQK